MIHANHEASHLAFARRRFRLRSVAFAPARTIHFYYIRKNLPGDALMRDYNEATEVRENQQDNHDSDRWEELATIAVNENYTMAESPKEIQGVKDESQLIDKQSFRIKQLALNIADMLERDSIKPGEIRKAFAELTPESAKQLLDSLRLVIALKKLPYTVDFQMVKIPHPQDMLPVMPREHIEPAYKIGGLEIKNTLTGDTTSVNLARFGTAPRGSISLPSRMQ